MSSVCTDFVFSITKEASKLGKRKDFLKQQGIAGGGWGFLKDLVTDILMKR